LGNTAQVLSLKGFVVAHDSVFVAVIRQFPYLLRFLLYLEQLTYSDNQCTQVSSGNDYRAEGAFTLEDGGTLEGKQLTKITATMTVLFSEGIAALFTPIGSTQTIVAKQYLDGDTSYETDDSYDLFTGQYREPTKIVYEEYLVKQ
jgi:hypothetical protein